MPRDEGNHPWPLRPNLLLLLADDMGWGDWPNANTPLRHLDALAAAGTRFTAFYTPSCICSPARGALLTGRMAIRWGGAGATWHGTAFGAGANGGLPASEHTIGTELRSLGYATAMAGKWHLGQAAGHTPRDHGFDRFLGIPFSTDMGSSAWQLSDALPLPLLANESIAEQPADIGALTATYLSFSREFVFSAARRAQPWFLFVSFHQPHVPLAPSPRFCNRSAAGSYGDTLLEMDEAIGELGRIVSEAGAARSTLTLFASDNGPWVEMAPAAGSAGPLRGGKFTTYEGGIRALAGRRAGRPRDGRRGLAAGRAPHRRPARGRDSARAAARREGPPPAPVRAERGEPPAPPPRRHPRPLLSCLGPHRRARTAASSSLEARPAPAAAATGGGAPACGRRPVAFTHPRRPFEWNQVPRPVGCALRRLQAALRHARRPAHLPGGEAAPLPRRAGRGRVEAAPRAPPRRRARRLLALRGRALDRADQRLRRRSGGDAAGQQRSASRP
uniref:Sulfatase N-terminal domain-containing protein n=1 Tax=Emiliania huxleyi TaxID=2903 RepID=A0A7S3S9Z3_EMIHU